MKNKRLTKRMFGGAWLLGVTAVMSKVLGAVYRIPLTRALGVHGMGLYQSVFPLYALLVTVTGGGLTAAVSKAVAEEKDGAIAKTTLWAAVGFAGVVSLVAAALAHPIASAAGAPQATAALLILLPGVPLSAACAVLRGWFQGAGNLFPSAVGQLVEQTVKLAVGLTLAFSLAPISLLAGVAGCAAGVTAGEAATALYYRFRYRRAAEKPESGANDGTENAAGATSAAAVTAQTSAEFAADTAAVFAPDAAVETQEISSDASSDLAAEEGTAVAVARRNPFALSTATRRILRKILPMALPVTLGLMVLPLCQVADSFLVVNLLSRAGTARETATSLYGIVTGPVNSLISMPSVLTVGLGSMLLPKVSAAVARGEDAGRAVKRSFIVATAVGGLSAACLTAFAPFAVTILYGVSLGSPLSFVAQLVRLSAPAAACLCVIGTASATLQGCGKAFVPARNLLIAAVVKEGLQFALLPKCGITGFVLATDVFYVLACMLDCIAAARAVAACKKRDPFASENRERTRKKRGDKSASGHVK